MARLKAVQHWRKRKDVLSSKPSASKPKNAQAKQRSTPKHPGPIDYSPNVVCVLQVAKPRSTMVGHLIADSGAIVARIGGDDCGDDSDDCSFEH